MENDTIVWIVLGVIALWIVFWAWKFEHNENVLIEHKPKLEDVPVGEREKYLQSLACFGYSEAVTWRRNVIAAIIATFVIFIFLRKTTAMTIPIILTIAFIIVAVIMAFDNFQSYHISRAICQKATYEDAPWFDDIANRHPIE